MLGKRTLTAAALGGVLVVGLGGAAATGAPQAAAQPVTYRTASGASHLYSDFGEEARQPLGAGVRLASSAIVVQTGAAPWNGPEMPVSLLTGATDLESFRYRLFDQDGTAITGPRDDFGTHVYYHASVRTANGVHAADLATVQTDGDGWAYVSFTRPLVEAPASVVVSGSAPYRGPGLPLNLVATTYSGTGFQVRALDQDGQPIANERIRLHYWATVQTATPNTRAGTAPVTPDAQGLARVHWQAFRRGLLPASVVLTGVVPHGGPDMPVNLVVVQVDGDAATIRALDQAGEPITTPFRVAYYATTRTAS